MNPSSMPSLNFHLADSTKGKINITQEGNAYSIYFPCQSTHNCTDYQAKFPPGIYYIELYGASGASYSPSTSYRFSDGTHLNESIVKFYKGNAKDKNISSNAGSGGYTAGILTLTKHTNMFLAIGGIGESSSGNSSYPSCGSPYTYAEDLDKIPRGGYNGGGSSLASSFDSYAGGGATDIRAEKNDWFHRIMVAGGGGASDNKGGSYKGTDDGSGGAGGGLIAQGHFTKGTLISTHCATQESGFSFGQGEASRVAGSKHENGLIIYNGCIDKAGAGGGWYGGFASHHYDGGAGGGSSFALTYNATIPHGLIPVYDEFYNKTDEQYYAFQNSEYIISHPIFVAGIW